MASTSSQHNQTHREKRYHNEKSMLGVTKKLYLNEETADVYFAFTVDDMETLVPAHKNLLVTCSPVFHAMFFGDLKETGNVKIVDASVDGFKDFLTIFYFDEVIITNENCAELTYLMNKYEMPNGLQMCEDFLLENTKTDELCTHFGLATTFNLHKLQKYCKKQITANATEIFKSDGFTKTTPKMLRTILVLNNHNCTASEIFEGCIKWAKKTCERNGVDATDKQNLRRVLGDCFYLIPFVVMKLTEFMRVASFNRTMLTLDEVLDIQNYITMGTLTENTRKFIKFHMFTMKYVFMWDVRSLLTCVRDGQKYGFQILPTELTTFSSTHVLSFGGFEISRILKYPWVTNVLKTVVTILREDRSLTSNQLIENLVNGTKVKLDKPIFIKPHTKYTIKVEFMENGSSNATLKGWRCIGNWGLTSYTLPSDIRIEFHKDLEMGVKNEHSSIVSKLHFNRL